MLRFHFGESMFAAFSVPIEKGRLADVGSGAGFPGLALGIVLPGLSITLIESNSKKAAFLAEVARELNLRHVEVIRHRFEEAPDKLGEFDYVTARAPRKHGDLLSWARGIPSKAGRLGLVLGENEDRRGSAAPWLTVG